MSQCAVCILVAFATPALSQPIAEVETESEYLDVYLGPQTLPGHEKGPRERATKPKATPRIPESTPPTRFIHRDHLTGDWFGARPWLGTRGVTIEAGAVFDLSATMVGGVRHRLDSRSLFDVNATFDLNTIASLPGATVFVDYQWQTGRDGSMDVGDIQAFSNIDTPSFAELYELWFEQHLFNNRVRVKVGKIDANSEFAFVENGGEFINSSMGFSPTILALPTYPDPAFSVNLFAYPTDWLYAGFGMYDGSTQAGVATGRRGMRTFFGGASTELFFIGEVGVTYSLADGSLPGRVGVGGWGHTANFTRFDGGVESGTAGMYLVFDQRVWCENPDIKDDAQGVGCFFQCGLADKHVSEITQHVGAGLVWTGPIPDRDDDIFGVGVSSAILSGTPGAGFADNAETICECFYKFSITPAISVKPDIQYIMNPSGDSAIRNALVGTLRVEIVF